MAPNAPLTVEERFVPPVRKEAWAVDQEMSREQFFADARRRGGWSESAWQRILWHGGLHLNRRRVGLEDVPDRIGVGARVVIYEFCREPEPVEIGAQAICFRAPGVVAVNKPPWLTVQGTRASAQFSVETQLRKLLSCDWITPVHRLDRQTSGVNLFALDSATAHLLHRQFEERTVEKEYWAWVSPVPARPQWTVRGFIHQKEHPRHAFFGLSEKAMAGGRFSETEFALLERRGALALVCARPRTGRTHQIRVHLAHQGTPIIGDPLYGIPRPLPVVPERLMLHAGTLRLVVPGHVGPTTITAPPPLDFVRIGERARALALAAEPC